MGRCSACAVACLVVCAVGVNAFGGLVLASDRTPVRFEIAHQTQPGQSVFVLGSLEELGRERLRESVKLEASGYPTWGVTVALPRGATFTYQYFVRDDGAGDWGNNSNGTAISGVMTGAAAVEDDPGEDDPGEDDPGGGDTAGSGGDAGITVFAETGFEQPVVVWETATRVSGVVPMHDVAEGRHGRERRVAAELPVGRTERVYFLVQDLATGATHPASRAFEAGADRVLVRGEHAFVFAPPGDEAPSPQRKAYAPSFPPGIDSVVLGERRAYRVLLPRGYDEHTEKRYPVIYFHDGQNVFDQGAFGSWDADETAAWMTRGTLMREVIMVGVDNTGNRAQDYLPPDDGFSADDYTRFIELELMPEIDGAYRTLRGPANTASVGSSFGGVASLYQGFERRDLFGRVGAFSTSFWAIPSLRSRVVQEPSPAGWRLYLDTGDAGNSNDGFAGTVSVRDGLLGKASGPSVLFDDLRFVLGPGDVHTERDWASRLPEAYAYLFPADEETPYAAGSGSLSEWSIEPVCLVDIAGGPFALNGGDGVVNIFDALGQLRRMDAGETHGDAAEPAGVFDGADARVLIERAVAGCEAVLVR